MNYSTIRENDMNYWRRAMLLAVAMLLSGLSVTRAHHSFTAVFDGSKPVSLQGTVVLFEFINPHGWVTLETPTENGAPARWRVEVANPNALIRMGWRKDSLKPGDKVTITGFRARDGSNTAFGQEFILADGKKVLSSAPPASE